MDTKLEKYGQIQNLVQKEARDIAVSVFKELSQQSQYKVPTVGYHVHNNIDSPNIPFENVDNRLLFVQWTVPGTQAQTSSNYSTFWIAPVACNVLSISEVHQTAGSDIGNVTLNVEKLTGTTAPGSGTTILSTAFNLKATANTVQNGTLTNTLSTKQLAVGNRLALKVSGTLTALVNVTVMVTIQF